MANKTYLRHDGIGEPVPSGLFHDEIETQRYYTVRFDDPIDPGAESTVGAAVDHTFTPQGTGVGCWRNQLPIPLVASENVLRYDYLSGKWLYNTLIRVTVSDGYAWIEALPGQGFGSQPGSPEPYDYYPTSPGTNSIYFYIHAWHELSYISANLWRYTAANGGKLEYRNDSILCGYKIEASGADYIVRLPDNRDLTLTYNVAIGRWIGYIENAAISYTGTGIDLHLAMDYAGTEFTNTSHPPGLQIDDPSFYNADASRITLTVGLRIRSWFRYRRRCLDPPARTAISTPREITGADSEEAPQYLDRNFTPTAGGVGDEPIAFDFEKWTFNGSEQEGRTLSIDETEDIYATAYYLRRTVELTVALDGIMAATVAGSYSAPHPYGGKTGPLSFRITDSSLMREAWAGVEMTLTAPATVDVDGTIYEFVRWEYGDEQTSALLALVRTIDATETITAIYTEQ